MANAHSESAALPSTANARLLMRLAVMLLTPFSLGNFNTEIISAEFAVVQQLLTLALWMVVIALSYLVPARGRMAVASDTYWAIAFYGIAVASVLWANYSGESIAKAAALLVTTFAAYRLTCQLTLSEIIDSVMMGLFGVVAASLLAVAIVPDIGVLHTWMHDGQWAGVFQSKQSLGIGGALLVYLALQSFSAQRRYFPLIAGAAGVLGAYGSGSRGGFVVVGAAAACSWLVQRSARFTIAVTMLPLLTTAVAIGLIVYMVQSSVPYYELFGSEFDITERTFIWHYALSHWSERPFFGLGLNGFWTSDVTLADFRRENGWVLDNYHSGYIAILAETGIVGFSAFVMCYFLNAMRLINPRRGQLLTRQENALVLGLTTVIFVINLTETYFLRSTNVIASLLAIMLFASNIVRTDTR